MSKVELLFNTKAEDEIVRNLPFNIPAEQAVIGAVLHNNELLGRISDIVSPEQFYEPVHQRIFDVILKLTDKGQIATPTTLKNYFDKDESLSDVGGAEYLIRITGNPNAIINLESYAKVVQDCYMRRRLVDIGSGIVNNAYEHNIDNPSEHQIESAEQSLFELASQGTSDKGFQALRGALSTALTIAETAHKRVDKLSGISTGFTDLDALLGGLHNSDLLILAGRPSMGKTALSVNLALNACQRLARSHTDKTTHAPSVGFFSLEMSAEQLAARMIAMESGVDSSKMRMGTLTDDEFAKIVEGNKNLYGLPFFIDDTPALSISGLRTRARRLKRKHNLGMLIIDYLQLVRGSSKASEANRVQEISEITQGLKAIAKELNIPVIALSQLSRAVEQREDKRPQLSDLRESGSIEQDADVVMFIFREEYYEERRKPPESDDKKFQEWQARMESCMNITEVIIAKHRNGPIGTAKLFFSAKTTKFEDLTQAYKGADFY